MNILLIKQNLLSHIPHVMKEKAINVNVYKELKCSSVNGTFNQEQSLAELLGKIIIYLEKKEK